MADNDHNKQDPKAREFLFDAMKHMATLNTGAILAVIALLKHFGVSGTKSSDEAIGILSLFALSLGASVFSMFWFSVEALFGRTSDPKVPSKLVAMPAVIAASAFVGALMVMILKSTYRGLFN